MWKNENGHFFAPPTEYFPRPNFLFLSATRPDPNLCKPKADMSEISKPDQTQNPDQIIVGSSDIILCFLNIFFVIVGLLVVRPHCVIRWLSFRFVSVGDFAGHKSEIVFWHMNMLCIKPRQRDPKSGGENPRRRQPPFESQTTFLLRSGNGVICWKSRGRWWHSVGWAFGLEVDADLGSLPRAFRASNGLCHFNLHTRAARLEFI